MARGIYDNIHFAYDFNLKGLDCMLRPDMCGPNASCKETNKKVGKQWNYHQCVCNPGFVGNGITCIDASDLANGDSFFFLSFSTSHTHFTNPEYFVCLLFEYFFQIKVLR